MGGQQADFTAPEILSPSFRDRCGERPVPREMKQLTCEGSAKAFVKPVDETLRKTIIRLQFQLISA
jgi:hypothetical protein